MLQIWQVLCLTCALSSQLLVYTSKLAAMLSWVSIADCMPNSSSINNHRLIPEPIKCLEDWASCRSSYCPHLAWPPRAPWGERFEKEFGQRTLDIQLNVSSSLGTRPSLMSILPATMSDHRQLKTMSWPQPFMTCRYSSGSWVTYVWGLPTAHEQPVLTVMVYAGNL